MDPVPRELDGPPTKRQKLAALPPQSSAQLLATAPGTTAPEKPAPPVVAKSRRVRTGCLTCRERHLKCDEAAPDCLNCRKSSRECKRGVRLNFIDVQVRDPPLLPPTADWEGQSPPFHIGPVPRGSLGDGCVGRGADGH